MMLTSEKFLKIISAAIVAVTVIFTVVVVVKEINKPKDVLENIKLNKCSEVFETTLAPANETALGDSGKECVFIPKAQESGSEFTAELFRFRRLEGFDYLFSGEKGLLLKKSSAPFGQQAEFIFGCLRKSECSTKLPDLHYTVSAAAYDLSGNIAISTTYDDVSLLQIANGMPKLFGEIAKIKELDMNRLRVVLYFHSEYAYIENKSDNNLISLPKTGIDGLYIKSRGAKIRVLPWEYSVNPLSVLDRKGVQYGLDKDEYKKDVASVYFYRTSQFAENKGETLPWLDGSALKKEDYSDLFSLRLISKHLKNIQKEDGSFPLELNMPDAAEKENQGSMLMQIYAAELLYKMAEILDDASLHDAAERAVVYFLGTNDVDEAAEAKAAVVIKNREAAGNHDFGRFASYKTADELISLHPVYSGLFIEAYSLLSSEKQKDENISALLTKAFLLYDRMNDENKMRFIAYLLEFNSENGTGPHTAVKNFIVSQTDFIKSHSYDTHGFPHEKGSFIIDRSKRRPEISLSLLMAAGLSKAALYGCTNSEITELVSASSAFINRLITTDDDIPNWGNTVSKTKIQGGVRSSSKGKTVKLSNTLRAADYFIHEIERGKIQ